MITYLAEGATGAFFDTRLALANPTGTPALVLTRFQKGDGTTVSDYRVVPPYSRATLDVETLAGLGAAEFSTLVEADVQVVADRTMSWDASGYGSHAERGILSRTATKWYFAEGATFGPFNLFYLIQNPNAQAAHGHRDAICLRQGCRSPSSTWWHRRAASTSGWTTKAQPTRRWPHWPTPTLSAIIESTNGVPIIAERAMYLDQPGRPLGAGHESAGVTAPSDEWFLAEGRHGHASLTCSSCIANPQATPATVQADYLLDTGQVITRTYAVPGNSRFNIWVDSGAGAVQRRALDARHLDQRRTHHRRACDVVAGADLEHAGSEAHNSPGETSTGTRWAHGRG